MTQTPPVEFTGNPAPFTSADLAEAANVLGCPVAALRAVIAVESRGGFLPDGRPRILFERHKFSALTAGAFDETHPEVSARRPGGYLGGAREYDRLAEALSLHREAALKSASWGAFQIMGFNHAAAGHADVEGFVAAMVSGEPAQLAAFVCFIRAQGLAGALARADWPAFARAYNGPAQAAHAYDRRIAQAYARFQAEDTAAPAAPPSARPLLQSGARGEGVRQLQRLLGVAADGVFGPVTRQALIARQCVAGLAPDGVAGPLTWAWLLGA